MKILLCLIGIHQWFCFEVIEAVSGNELEVPKCGRCDKLKIDY